MKIDKRAQGSILLAIVAVINLFAFVLFAITLVLAYSAGNLILVAGLGILFVALQVFANLCVHKAGQRVIYCQED